MAATTEAIMPIMPEYPEELSFTSVFAEKLAAALAEDYEPFFNRG